MGLVYDLLQSCVTEYRATIMWALLMTQVLSVCRLEMILPFSDVNIILYYNYYCFDILYLFIHFLQVLDNLPHDLIYSENQISPWMEVWVGRQHDR